MKNPDRYQRICKSLEEREMKNLGRWCEITMKKTGETFTLVRTGYGPMEYPTGDSHKLLNSEGEVVVEGSFYDCARWIHENY